MCSLVYCYNSELMQQDSSKIKMAKTFVCDKHDRNIPCDFSDHFYFTVLCSNLFVKICLKEGDLWQKIYSGLPSSFLCPLFTQVQEWYTVHEGSRLTLCSPGSQVTSTIAILSTLLQWLWYGSPLKYFIIIQSAVVMRNWNYDQEMISNQSTAHSSICLGVTRVNPEALSEVRTF